MGRCLRLSLIFNPKNGQQEILSKEILQVLQGAGEGD